MKSSILIYILHVSLVNFSPDTEFTSVTKNGTCLSNQPKWWNNRYRILIINGLTVYVPKSSDIYKFNFKKNVKLKRLKNLQVTNYSNFIKQAGGVGEPNHQKYFPYWKPEVIQNITKWRNRSRGRFNGILVFHLCSV